MAEVFLNHLAGEHFTAESAGLEPGKLNPLAVQVMNEAGIDISKNKTKSVNDLLNKGKSYDYVITVCDETSAERCPAFPGQVKRLHWGFPDPSALLGSPAERIAATRQIRDAIKQNVKDWSQAIRQAPVEKRND